ncbi:hypothetical protein O3P69_000965 [Scylla paramamosain]|uniref:Uncharacterized protein n=1 Tax=Scylla paramamosain TaxID=85552 RepID=A0AAW0UV77_SCYPA
MKWRERSVLSDEVTAVPPSLCLRTSHHALDHSDRLKETRRLRGQLIVVFKILRGFDNVDYRCLFQLSKGHTRNNGYKLELKRYNRDLCGNFFSHKICSRWNALSSDVVNSDSVEQFKIPTRQGAA